MRKKISILLLTLICAMSFTACGSTEEVDYDVTSISSMSSNLVVAFASMDADTIDTYQAGEEFELNMIMYESGIPADAETFVDILTAWETAVSECGAFVSLDSDFVSEVSGDEVILTAAATFTEKEVSITYIYEDGMISSLTIDPEYSFGEIITKAILNTILGMGTVFAVLIFIAFVISLFKYIPMLEEKFKKKSATPQVEAAPVVAPVVVEEVNVNADLDLVAVITAAIAASEGTTTDGFVVRSIKRRKSNKWNA